MTVSKNRAALRKMSLAQARQAVRELKATKAATVMGGSRVLVLDYALWAYGVRFSEYDKGILASCMISWR